MDGWGKVELFSLKCYHQYALFFKATLIGLSALLSL